MSRLVGVVEPDSAVRPARRRALSWFAAALSLVSLVSYAVLVGPDLVDTWRSSNPDAGLVRWVTTMFLLLVLGFAAALLVAARLLRPGRAGGRSAQLAGAMLVVLLAIALIFAGYLFRSGVLHPQDPAGKVAMLTGLAMLVGGIGVAWPPRR